MLRIRRYRIFLVVAILSILTIYHLTHVGDWDAASNISIESLKKLGGQSTSPDTTTSKLTETQNDAAKPAGRPGLGEEGNVPVVNEPSSTEILPTTEATSTKASPLSTSTTLLDIVQPTESPAAATVGKLASEKGQANAEDEDTEPALPADVIKQQFGQSAQGRLETRPPNDGGPDAHWQKQQEMFPVAPGSLIPLPTGKPVKIPKIQKEFAEELPEQRVDRERKLATVRAAFEHAWSGYKEFASPHDELRPVSAEFRDPFNGWGATLVDTLDTLWIMGFKEDFEYAVQAVEQIDFTTSTRKDIPLFETVIRYLGGLVAAYDISEMQYPTLLKKAKELAEVLMGAFDTPNRMPDTYYRWAPSYASQPHRSGTKVVLAELGSLSVEFTRLAQLTGEDRYYDAIARITDELEAWQGKTKIPGLWPVHLDASGCKKSEKVVQPFHSNPGSKFGGTPMTGSAMGASNSAGSRDMSIASKGVSTGSEGALSTSQGTSSGIEEQSSNLGSLSNAGNIQSEGMQSSKATLAKRQLDDASLSTLPSTTNADVASDATAVTGSLNVPAPRPPKVITDPDEVVKAMQEVDCIPQGLASPPHVRYDTFSLGAMTDSTYEYLPKEYMLLGGQIDKYRTMYMEAMDAAREKLLFRPMTKKNRNILFAGKFSTAGKMDPTEETMTMPSTAEDKFTPEGAHLTCFAGGMFAIGAKTFGIEGDMDIASRLTDGCVWAYEITPTGIMPEAFNVVPCKNKDNCPWDENAWYDEVDPDAEARIEHIKNWNENQRKLAEKLAADEAQARLDDLNRPSEPESVNHGYDNSASSSTVRSSSLEEDGVAGLKKRQIAKSAIKYEDETTAAGTIPDDNGGQPTKTTTTKVEVDNAQHLDEVDATQILKTIFTPQPVVSHEDYARTRITEQRLPEGFVGIDSKHYILRPEAIESVWIMYRITGDNYWREKGWNMFTAIEKYTRTQFGNSAIKDVTSEIPEYDDTMESFWLAETLKYFYLLFAGPDVVNLDDWVLNTEAHPFLRPKAVA